MATPREQEPTDGLIYVNWARSMGSPFELMLDLGFRTDDAPPPDFPIRVVMSWEHAKGFALLLQDAVKHYEQEVGPIRDLGAEIMEADDPESQDVGERS